MFVWSRTMPATTRSPTPSTPRPIGGPAAPPVDISSSMPRTMRDDLTGDFLGRGYDQRMRAEVSNLNIYDSPSRGGARLQSTPMDLAPFPESGVSYTSLTGSEIPSPSTRGPITGTKARTPAQTASIPSGMLTTSTRSTSLATMTLCSSLGQRDRRSPAPALPQFALRGAARRFVR